VKPIRTISPYEMVPVKVAPDTIMNVDSRPETETSDRPLPAGQRVPTILTREILGPAGVTL
jgi:hypothetical protein